MSEHPPILYIILAVLVDSLAGLAGGLLPTAWIQRHLTTVLAFAAGTLIGTAFLDLLPEALQHMTNPHSIMVATLIGFLVFYVIESFLGSHATGQSGHKHDTIGPMILIGDALHNATDGMAIAAAFSINTFTGISTTIAVVVHELPQEISDYTILLSHGYSKAKALFYLFLVQLTALIGALGTIWFSQFVENLSVYLMALSAGGFIYIAAADLLPELHQRKNSTNNALVLSAFAFGITVITIIHGL